MAKKRGGLYSAVLAYASKSKGALHTKRLKISWLTGKKLIKLRKRPGKELKESEKWR